jgi:DNA modification methylase
VTWRVVQGDVRAVLPSLPDESVHCCISSPPYWGLRDYGVDGQIGQEPTPEEFVATMVQVFREVRRVLRADGTLWLNLGDSYAGARGGPQGTSGEMNGRAVSTRRQGVKTRRGSGLKSKDLVGVPWMVAFALRADGWYLRQDIIWHKPNPMPESVADRCTKAHEYLFLLSKSSSYHYDAAAIAEPCSGPGPGNAPGNKHESAYRESGDERLRTRANLSKIGDRETRNRRSVWNIATHPFAEAHFATFPPQLVEPCVLAGCPIGGTVLDPFSGSGTTGMVALRHQRNYVGVELNSEYVEMSRRRINGDQPLLNVEAAS